MATNNVNTVRSQIENSANPGGNISGSSIERTVKNSSGANIGVLAPIVNAGWNNAENCMLVRTTNSLDDIIIGIILTGINNGSTKVVKYITSGLVKGINTSAWNKDDFLYANTLGQLTNNPEEETTIAQEIALVIRSHATEGEIFVSTMANQVKFLRLAIAVLAAQDAPAGSAASGETMNIRAGAGDGSGAGGDVIAKPGKGGLSGTDGMFIVPQAGTAKSANKYLAFWHDGLNAILKAFTGVFIFWNKIVSRHSSDTDGTKQTEMGHDGTDGYIEPKYGNLKTNNKTIDVGTGSVKATSANSGGYYFSTVARLRVQPGSNTIEAITADGSAYYNFAAKDISGTSLTLSGLTASKIVETDANKKLISVDKKTGYNKDLGTGSGTVAEGNHNHADMIDSANKNVTVTSNVAGGLYFGTAARIRYQSNGQYVEVITADGSAYCNLAAKKVLAASLQISGLTGDRIMETDSNSNVVSVQKNNGYNLNLTVNTVNPTAPNRTIKLTIGGTDYYIHAKTTND